jgi:hypothetical protein
MSKRMLEVLDELLPPIPRGQPHHMMREKQRSAFKVGYMRGFNDGRHGVPKSRRSKDVIDR